MASGSGGVQATISGCDRPEHDLGARAPAASTSAPVGAVDDRILLLARGLVALDGFTRQCAGATDVAATRQREERDGTQDDDDADGEGDDCCGTHDVGVSFRSL